MEERAIGAELAELAGLFAADGNMQKAHISFWGHMQDDRDYYNGRVRQLFRKAFNIAINPHDKKSNSVYGFYVCKSEIIEVFNQFLGFPLGNKTYTVRVPRTILESDDQAVWSAFLRGYFDGDGTFVCFRRGTGYLAIRQILHMEPRIQVASTSKGLISDVKVLLDKLDIKYYCRKHEPKRSNESEYWKISINGRNRTKKFITIVGFGNPSKQARVDIFERHGFLPPSTTHADRRAILKGELCPLSLYL